ncbi:MAG: hypothetical protein ABI697_07735 [Devosia sp.]
MLKLTLINAGTLALAAVACLGQVGGATAADLTPLAAKEAAYVAQALGIAFLDTYVGMSRADQTRVLFRVANSLPSDKGPAVAVTSDCGVLQASLSN